MTLRVLRVVVVWTVIVVALMAITVAVFIPRLAGATPYTVLTESMRPTLPPGTLVVVKPVAMGHIGIGDVVTYQLKSGRPAVVTHRVVALGFNADHDRILRTKGDANKSADAKGVIAEQVRGRVWYAVPVLGGLSNVISGRQRSIATTVIVIGLVAYAVLIVAGATCDRMKSEATRTQKEEP